LPAARHRRRTSEAGLPPLRADVSGAGGRTPGPL
jgi:hypothetical protein